MVSLADALAGAAKDAYCSLSGPVANGVSALGDLSRAGGNGIVANGYSKAAQLLRNAQNVFCDRIPDDVSPVVGPPFSGGQCPGQLYTVTVTAEGYRNGSLSIADTQVVTGPGPVNIFQTSDASPGLVGSSVKVSFGDGSEFNVVGVFGVEGQDTVSTEITASDVQPLPGETDDCGDPPERGPEYSPDNWTAPRTVNYDGPGGGPESTDVDFTFGPHTVGPDGAIFVPTVVVFDNDVEANFNLDLNVGELNLFPGAGQPGSESTDPQEREEEENEPETETEIIGVRIISTRNSESPRHTEVGQSGGNPNILLPRTGNISFLYRTGDGRAGWGEAIPVQGENFVIWAQRPALRVAGTADTGWNIKLFPIVRVKSGCCE